MKGVLRSPGLPVLPPLAAPPASLAPGLPWPCRQLFFLAGLGWGGVLFSFNQGSSAGPPLPEMAKNHKKPVFS